MSEEMWRATWESGLKTIELKAFQQAETFEKRSRKEIARSGTQDSETVKFASSAGSPALAKVVKLLRDSWKPFTRSEVFEFMHPVEEQIAENVIKSMYGTWNSVENRDEYEGPLFDVDPTSVTPMVLPSHSEGDPVDIASATHIVIQGRDEVDQV